MTKCKKKKSNEVNYLLHGALSDLILGDIVHIVHTEGGIAFELHHELLTDLKVVNRGEKKYPWWLVSGLVVIQCLMRLTFARTAPSAQFSHSLPIIIFFACWGGIARNVILPW